MIHLNEFIQGLKESNIEFFTGVPDSLLKNICAQINDSYSKENHIIAANEGSAIALAIGYYLAKRKPALVYMQNSGLGNSINPLVSLADPMIYGIPMILLIGWRGELLQDGSQIKDEPQHLMQGKITKEMLDILGIPFSIIDSETKNIVEVIKRCRKMAAERSGPVAILARKGTFSAYNSNKNDLITDLPTREKAITNIIDNAPSDCVLVSTTGMASREVFEHRKRLNQGHEKDFLTVGGMGHANQIATGIATFSPEKKVVCIDGDGALLMHCGGLANVADCNNLIHFVLNNGAHDSVGGQPTKAFEISLIGVAKGFGYQHYRSINSVNEIKKVFNDLEKIDGSIFIEIKCQKGSRKDLGRPDKSPAHNKNRFMEYLKNAQAR